MTADAGVPSDVEVACEFILEHVKASARHTWQQGRREPALPCSSRSPRVRLFCEMRLNGVPTDAALGILAWANGFPVELRRDVPGARHILSLQARGGRCVSLLEHELGDGHYRHPLAFALHDLRHLAKFAAPAHYAEQVGFFLSMERALRTTAWQACEASLDATWKDDRDQVLADMNGSSIFLFTALKMKLKMAARRQLALELGRAAVSSGPLSVEEEACFGDLLSVLLDSMQLEGALRAAAVATSARRDDPLSAALLAEHFAALGQQNAPGPLGPRGVRTVET